MRLSRVDVQATPNAGGAALAALFGLREGDRRERRARQRRGDRLFGRGEFERIEVDIQDRTAAANCASSRSKRTGRAAGCAWAWNW